MGLPIVHSTAGYLVQRLDRRRTPWAGTARALAFMAIGNLPDVDFLVGFVAGRPGAFHRGISHTVLAALVFGLVAATVAWWRRWDDWRPAFLLCTAAYASHLLVDAFTIDQRGPAGAQFFWPLSDAYYISPLTIFGEILIDGRSRLGFVQSILAWPTVVVLTHEALWAGAAVATVRLSEWLRDRSGDPSGVVDLQEQAEEDPA
ncbi:MAG TPA: metal-dependent hydrolase [Candidatus Binatia bacterium]|jgi:membrane-bound metal-dependent hydrolase YbcI (DUF457 family)